MEDEKVSERKGTLAFGAAEILVGGVLAVCVVMLTPILELLEMFFAIVMIPLSLFGGIAMMTDGGRRIGKDGVEQITKKVEIYRAEMATQAEEKARPAKRRVKLKVQPEPVKAAQHARS